MGVEVYHLEGPGVVQQEEESLVQLTQVQQLHLSLVDQLADIEVVCEVIAHSGSHLMGQFQEDPLDLLLQWHALEDSRFTV